MTDPRRVFPRRASPDRIWPRILAAAALCLIAACRAAAPPVPATPAMWEITGPDGARGWLLGTIHALPGPVDWRTAPVNRALSEADRLVVEVANVADPGAVAATFSALGTGAGHPPLAQRIDPALAAEAERLRIAARLSPDAIARLETWALALTLARAAEDTADGSADARFGIDRQVIAAMRGKRLEELEGAEAQLRIFDSLPENEQRDLLNGTLAEAARPPAERERLRLAWQTGNVDQIAAELDSGLMADPELRKALLQDRNAAWTRQLDAMLRGGARPLVAVGAGHLAGPDGLPAMLAARGYTLRRVQ